MSTRYPECITPPQGHLDEDDCDEDYYEHMCERLTYKVEMQKLEIKSLTCELKRVTKLHQCTKEENKART